MEIVPKEVTRIDYYAVEHIRHYVKQIVPEVRVETRQVSKVIKNIETIPVEKYLPAKLGRSSSTRPISPTWSKSNCSPGPFSSSKGSASRRTPSTGPFRGTRSRHPATSPK